MKSHLSISCLISTGVLLGASACTPATQDSSGLSSAPERTQVTLCSDCDDQDKDEGDGDETVSSGASPSPSPSESTSPSSATSVSKDCPEGEFIYDLYLKSDGEGITDIGFKCATEEIASRNLLKPGRRISWVSLRSPTVLRDRDTKQRGIRLIADGSGSSSGRPTLGRTGLSIKTWLIGSTISDSQTTVHTGMGTDDKISSISFLYRRSRYCGFESLAAQRSLNMTSVDSCTGLPTLALGQNTYYRVGCESGQLIGGFKAELDEEGHITSINARTWILGFAGWTPSDCETTLAEELEI